MSNEQPRNIRPLFSLDSPPLAKETFEVAPKPKQLPLPPEIGKKYRLPPLPGTRKLAPTTYIGFAVCVLLPMLVATIYFAFIASNQYVAEFRFTVKDAGQRGTPQAPNLAAIFGGTTPNNFDNYLVTDFLTSRQAVELLVQRIDVRKLYSRPDIDWLSRHNSTRPIEQFVTYWQSMITARYDQITGIASAQVRAFSPEDALLVAKTLVTLSEELVNDIAHRTQTDAVRFAQNEVERAESRIRAVRVKLAEYRNRTGVIDPTTSVGASNSALIQSLRANLAQLETQYATLTRQNLEPSSPAIVVLNNQIRSTREQLQKIEAMVGQDTGGVALSKIIGEYEQLDLERQFAQAMLTSAMQALDQARTTAAAQQLYITPYVQPHLPQSSTYPRRLLSILIVGAIAFAFWLTGSLVMRSIRERFS